MSLCKPSKYKNISFIHFSLIFQPMSLNSKNRTNESGPYVSKITFKLEMTVADTLRMANANTNAKIHFFLNIIASYAVFCFVRIIHWEYLNYTSFTRNLFNADLSINRSSVGSRHVWLARYFIKARHFFFFFFANYYFVKSLFVLGETTK